MSNTSGPKILVGDGFNFLLDVGQRVVFVGRDHNLKPTLNYGVIEEVEPGRVMVRREKRATRHQHGSNADTTVRRVWVDTWKVTRCPGPVQEAA